MLRTLASLGVSAAVITFPHGTAVIRTADQTVRVRVEIASTPAQLQQGLSGRRTLAANAGMAFLWKSDVRGKFWMKNTSVPLSIAFWGKSGRILRILDMAPCRRDPCKVYDPKVAFRGALEVNEAAEVIRQTANDDTQIIFGATIDDRLTGQVWVTVIATGLGGTGRSASRTPSLVSALTAADDELEPPSFLRN